MRILCISDIHGNYDALAAVLASAETRGFSKVLVAGDIVFPGPAPLETWRRLTQLSAVMVQGVSDRAIATLDPDRITPKTEHERTRLERMKQARSELGELILERIKRLPPTARIPLEDGSEIVVVHGSPADPEEAMSHEMSDEELGALLGDDPADIVVCGMTHVPFDRTVAGVRILNVGSVGEAPDSTSSQQRTYAHATLIETTPSGIRVEPLVVGIAPIAKAAP
jgi:predicted phosphodiesterase